jgi:ACR3 family arsenite transporter
MDPTIDIDLESHRAPSQQSPAISPAENKSGCNAVDDTKPKESAFKGLGWLDRLLALWILLAMIIGILLGNFVPSVGPALHRGELVGVSIPIGRLTRANKDVMVYS